MGKGCWTEELWLQLIDTVNKVEGYENRHLLKHGGKWKVVANMLPANFFSTFPTDVVKPNFVRNAFCSLSCEVRGTRSRVRYVRVSELVRRKMKDHIDKQPSNMKQPAAKVFRTEAPAEKIAEAKGPCNQNSRVQLLKRPAAKVFPTEAIAEARAPCNQNSRVQLLKQLDKRFISLGHWFEKQLLPTAQRSLFSRLTPEVFGKPTTSNGDLKLTVETAFVQLRAEIIREMKQTTYVLSQQILEQLGN